MRGSVDQLRQRVEQAHLIRHQRCDHLAGRNLAAARSGMVGAAARKSSGGIEGVDWGESVKDKAIPSKGNALDAILCARLSRVPDYWSPIGAIVAGEMKRADNPG